jgi:hypothetical protein
MKHDDDIDHFFKEGLGEPDIPFDELDWKKMDEKLDAAQGKRVLPLWWLPAAGVAAALLLALFFVFQQKDSNIGAKPQIVEQSIDKRIPVPPSAPTSAQAPSHTSTPERIKNSSIVHTESAPLNEEPYYTKSTNQSVQPITKPKETFPNLQQPVVTLPERAADDSVPVAVVSSFVKKPAQPMARSTSPFTLSIIAAPDISSSPSSLSNKVSTNIGLLGTYSLTGKLSITTGLIYAKKLYDYGGTSSSAYGATGKGWEVDADCRVLDIPLNINYQLFKKGSNSITVNTGFSSYFMLNEKYKYINDDGLGNKSVSILEIVNKNRHPFGVANLSMSLNRQVTSQLNIGVQPFLKIPLTGVGYHDSKLRSAGVAFSLNLNLSKSVTTP